MCLSCAALLACGMPHEHLLHAALVVRPNSRSARCIRHLSRRVCTTCCRERVPSAWLRALAAASPSELSAVPSGYSCADWPSDLREFIREAREFSLQPTVQSGVEQPLAPQCQCQAQLDRVLYEGMSAKKRHEVRDWSAL